MPRGVRLFLGGTSVTIRTLAAAAAAVCLMAAAPWAATGKSCIPKLQEMGIQLADKNSMLMESDGQTAPMVAKATRTQLASAQSYIRVTLADFKTIGLEPDELTLYAERITELLGSIQELGRTGDLMDFPELSTLARSASASLRAAVQRQVTRDPRLYDAVVSAPGGTLWDSVNLLPPQEKP